MVCPQNPSLTKSRTGATLNISANDISDGVQKGVCGMIWKSRKQKPAACGGILSAACLTEEKLRKLESLKPWNCHG